VPSTDRLTTIVAFATTFLALVPATLCAAERRARLTVDVKIEGTESVVGGGTDRTAGKFREGYTLVTYLKSDGELAQFDMKDPQYAQKMMGLATGVQRKVQQAQGNTVRRMTPQELQDYVGKKQAACKSDQNCLMQLAMEVQQLSANLDMGASGAGASAQAYTGEEPPRYLNYFGYDNCGATAHVYADRTLTGTLGDVSGAVPYTVDDTADYTSNPVEDGLLCNTHNLVLDTQSNVFSSDGAILPTAKGTSTTTMRGKTTQATGEAATHGEAYTWVSEQLRRAPRSGSRTTTLKLTQNQGASIHTGKYTGEARVQLSWRLEDVK
jgi:hypothetical protein